MDGRMGTDASIESLNRCTCPTVPACHQDDPPATDRTPDAWNNALPSFAVKSRPPQSALTQCTDGGSGRLEHGSDSTPPHAGSATPSPERIMQIDFSQIDFSWLHRCRRSVSARLRLTPLSRSRNQRADGDGCVEFAPDAEVAHGLRV